MRSGQFIASWESPPSLCNQVQMPIGNALNASFLGLCVIRAGAGCVGKVFHAQEESYM